MRPIVDGLKNEYGDRVAFVYLNAADRAQGQAVFEKLALPGHPGSVVYTMDGRETYRGFGVVDESLLREKIESVINR